MNTLIEYEASKLADLFDQGDRIAMHMFMENMHMPIDVQNKLMEEISALNHIDQNSIGKIIENYGQSQFSERLTL
ncbi:hypothetical protein [Shewanella aestuarii]|uniref:Uncharacterized protein n=1 Tax=Shewanella aestuarii TaxID=1028752 RepID=A0A6G9QIJ4_9GAMM|nr:hypothetical protein [Shewanella aestuarii]QIR14218.1 hypothetical protein HBH39_06735 [Shewanella aestuarii]